MYKIKNLLLAVIALSSLLAGFIVVSPVRVDAAVCYTTTGPFRVQPQTHSCPAPVNGTGYYDMSEPRVRLTTVPTSDNRCFALQMQPSGVPGRTYNEYRCNDLETLRTNVARELCESTGGTFSLVNTGTTGQYTSSCSCPPGRTIDANGRCGGSSGDAANGDTTTPAFVRNDCNEDGPDPGTSSIDKDDCGITSYIVLAINVLSAMVAVVVIASIIIGGIQYSAAGSDPQKVSAAKNRIRNALLALFVFIFGYSFLNFLIPGGVL